MGSAANQFSLLFGRMEEPEAVLKTLAIHDLTLEFQWFLSISQLEFELNNFADGDVARYCSAQSTLSDVLGAAMQGCFFDLDDQAHVQQVAWMCSRQGPRMLFMWRRHRQNLITMLAIQGFTGELLIIKFPDGPLGMLGEHRISVRSNLLQRRQKLLVSAVAHGNGNIPPESGILGALDG